MRVGILLLAVIAAPLAAQEAPVDSLELEGMAIIGNRELPKALYIVPWKSPELGGIVGRPVESLMDGELAPADPDVLQRELEYYGAVHNAP
jgi:hypothetical protein